MRPKKRRGGLQNQASTATTSSTTPNTSSEQPSKTDDNTINSNQTDNVKPPTSTKGSKPNESTRKTRSQTAALMNELTKSEVTLNPSNPITEITAVNPEIPAIQQPTEDNNDDKMDTQTDKTIETETCAISEQLETMNLATNDSVELEQANGVETENSLVEFENFDELTIECITEEIVPADVSSEVVIEEDNTRSTLTEEVDIKIPSTADCNEEVPPIKDNNEMVADSVNSEISCKEESQQIETEPEKKTEAEEGGEVKKETSSSDICPIERQITKEEFMEIIQMKPSDDKSVVQVAKSETKNFEQQLLKTETEQIMKTETKKERKPRKVTIKEPPKQINKSRKSQAKKEPKPKTTITTTTKKETIKKQSNKIDDESSVRRSSRIKSINVLKQRPKGHGLVKLKKDAIKLVEADISENSNSTNSEKSTPSYESPNPSGLSDFDNNKPVKVKSRWRRTSELEMNVLNPTNNNFATTTTTSLSSVESNNSNDNENNNLAITEKTSKQPNEQDIEEVAIRLKQFVHLKENLYLTERFTCKEAKKMICDCFLTPDDISHGEYGCGDDCLNRLLMIECGQLCPIGERCTNKKFQKQQFAPVEVFKTEKKGLGLRAAANIPYGEFILEYVGEVLNYDEFDKRADNYSNDKNTHYYFMSLRADGIIDATRKGNISRFINHSCDPNAETQKWTVNGELRIGFFSKRTIFAGEEITFDYRFERYGKEAQKCYCEAPTCRGWLGEEPGDDDDDDEDEDEEEDQEEEEEENQKIKESTETKTENEKAENKKPIKEIKEKPEKSKRKYNRRKPRIKDIFEDLDQLEEEIEMVVTTGLKNQAHTLKLSRLMVRAKEPAQRTKLLRILRRGELPCRRLFLDYHGLRLMHGYMTDAEDLSKTNKKFESLRLEMLQTLATLPIPNKTMLEDSKVLPTVRKWSTNSNADNSPLDSNSSSPKIDSEAIPSTTTTTEDVNKLSVKEEEIKKEEESVDIKTENEIKDEKVLENKIVPENDKPITKETEKSTTDEDLEIRKSVGMDFEEEKNTSSEFKNISGQELAEEISNIFNEDTNESSTIENKTLPIKETPPAPVVDDDQPNYEEEIIALALKLLEEWSNLKEVFKIPKKERIEQMKEHEREANKVYIAGLGLEQDVEKKSEYRYRVLKRERFLNNDNNNRKIMKNDERNSNNNNSNNIQIQYSSSLGKLERRKLFAMRMEHKEEERRRKQRESWLKHEQHCILLGTDPRLTAPYDPNRGYQCIWNPQIGQWQNYPLNPLPTQNPNLLFNPNNPPTNYNQYPHLQSQQSHLQPHPQQQQQVGIPSNLHTLPTLPYQDELKKVEDFSQVRFMGPIPPPVKLPPKWKCAKDKYGRPYYYHIKIRKSQWEPPEIPPPVQEESSDTSSSSETSSTSSDTTSDDWDSDDDVDDTKLLLDVRKQMEKQLKLSFSKAPILLPIPVVNEETIAETTTTIEEEKIGSEVQIEETVVDDNEKEEVKIDKELVKDNNEQIDIVDESNKLKEQSDQVDEQKSITEPPPAKKKRVGLVREIIISPRTEEDRLQFREDLKRYKQNKEKLKRQKELILNQTKKHLKEKRHKTTVKTKMKEMLDSNSESSKKIKETFRSNMASVVVSVLNAYRKLDCKEGRITNTEDFKHLARKLTHFVMLKEMKHVLKIEDLVCTENVKSKAKEYIRKYMSKFGETYQKRNDEPDF